MVVAGRTRSAGQGGDDIGLWFLGSDGKTAAERVIATPDYDWLTDMVRLRDGGYALVGSQSDRDVSRSTGWLIRLDPEGKDMWRRDFDGGKTDGTAGLTGVAELVDGGFVVAGSTSNKGAGYYDGWVMRLDKDGRPLWDKSFGSNEEDALFGAAAMPDGGAVFAGTLGADGQGWILRLDRGGAVVWDNRFGGTGYDVFNTVVALPNGQSVVAGTTRSKGPAGGAAWVMRLNAKGEVMWEKLLTPVKAASANTVLALPDGGFLVVGGSIVDPNSSDKEQAWIARLGADGALLWSKVLGGAGDENLFSAMLMPDGGFALAGFTNTKGAGDGDVWVLRLGYK